MTKLCATLLPVLLLAAAACNRSPQALVERGDRLLAAGKADEAALNYRKAVQKDPKFGLGYLKLGQAYLETGDLIAANHAFATAVELMPETEEAKVALADLTLKGYLADPNRSARFYNKVRDLSNQILEHNPNSAEGLRFKGYLAMSDRRIPEALEIFRKAYAIKPGQPDVTLGLAQALIENKEYQQAERLGLDVIRKNKGFGPMYLLLSGLYAATNRPSDAEQILKQRVANNPKDAAGLLDLAGYYAAAKNSAEMSRILQRLVDDRQDFPQGPLQAGNFYLRVGNAAEAQRAFEQGSKVDPKALVYRKAIVNALVAGGKTDEAMAAVEAILKQFPDDMESLKTRALILADSAKAGERERGIAELRKLLGEDPDDYRLRYALGRAHLAAGDPDAARFDFQELVRRGGDPVRARLYLSEISLAKRDAATALAYADEILSVQPSNPNARFLRGTSLIGLKRYGQARRELSALIESDPQYTEPQLQLGFLDLIEKKYSEAEADFRKLYKPGQAQIRALQGLVEVRLAQRQPDQAVELLQQEAQARPNSPEVRTLLAATASRAGRYDLAIQQYQQLLAANPNSPGLLQRLAQVQRLKGDLGGSAATIQRVLQVDAKNTAVHLFLADLESDRGNREKAKQEYEKTLALEPDNAVALNNLAFLLIESGGDPDRALRLAQQAVRKDPNQPTYSDTLGMAYLRKNMTPSALQVFQTLIKAHPENPTFRYHLALALLNMGDKSGARSQLQTALTKKPDSNHDQIKQLLARIG